MSVAEIELYEGGSPPESVLGGEGRRWEGALCLAWAQITEGSAVCECCGETARALVATGADPEYEPLCWKSAAALIFASLDIGARLFAEDAAL